MDDARADSAQKARPAPQTAEPGAPSWQPTDDNETTGVDAMDVSRDDEDPRAGSAARARATEPATDAEQDHSNDNASVGAPSVFSTGLSVRVAVFSPPVPRTEGLTMLQVDDSSDADSSVGDVDQA